MQIKLPVYQFKTKLEAGKKWIFDPIRKKYVVLTPEEWVRQNFISFLHHEYGYPLSLMVLEQSLQYGRTNKRADIVVYDTMGSMSLIVECKASNVKITQDTFDQIARYNMVLKIPFLVVTNGVQNYCCKMDYEKETYQFLERIPNFVNQNT